MKRILMLLLLLLLLALTLGVPTAYADVVRGRVVDAETKEPVPDASVKYVRRVGEYAYSTTIFQADSLGVFQFAGAGRGTIEVSMLGYYTKSRPVMALGDSQKDTLDLGTVELKMSPQMLRLIEVEGRAKRFSVRGDTIVFHPEAFHLQEGARLDELIRKLPGVEVQDDGSLRWNGKPIRIIMDGEDIFGGADLIGKLPAEAVQNIKAYNKASEFAERTGRDDGREDMVLDLTIKPGFLDRWYGNVKGGYQTPEYYEAELTMNRLSKSDPVMVFADANNIEKRHRRTMNGSSSSWSNGFGTELGGAAGWQHNWQREQGTRQLRSDVSAVGSLKHDDAWSSSRSETETYLPGTTPLRSASDSYRRSHELAPNLRADMTWRHDTCNTWKATIMADLKKTRAHDRGSSHQEQFEADAYVPSIDHRTAGRSQGHEASLKADASWDHYIFPSSSVGGSVSLSLTDGEKERWTDRIITDYLSADGGSDGIGTDEGRASATETRLTQYARTPSQRVAADAQAYAKRWVSERLLLGATYRLVLERKRSHEDFMTDGMADDMNSFRNRYSRWQHTLDLSPTLTLPRDVQLMPSVRGRWLREEQDYARGLLDTSAVRRRLFVDPSVLLKWKIRRHMALVANYGFSTRQPGLLQTVGYRNTTNPLHITEGNPALRDMHSHAATLKYDMTLAERQLALNASLSASTSDRNNVTALTYDPATGIYVSRPENVRGSRQWELRLGYDHGLGDYFRLQNDFRLASGRHYGYLTRRPDEALPTPNRQESLKPFDRLTLSFDRHWLKAAVYAKVNVERLRYSLSPDQNASLRDHDFGLRLEATAGAFVFVSNLSEQVRRGYDVRSMNRNLLVWDGSVTWKCLKNKGQLKLEFEDLLNNEDEFYSSQTAYQQTSTWSDIRHHYIGLSFNYFWDAKKKD